MSWWKCQSCGETHAGNPSECSNCGNHVLAQYDPTWGERLLSTRMVLLYLVLIGGAVFFAYQNGMIPAGL